jgi:ABC-type branched-subunit amino acid transport system substrate-binding protein/tRNA A-37 threonylcarbamoyl transferase component Bud32
MPLAPGMSLGDGNRYVIDKSLGKGGMGSIFLAHDTRVNNKPVVIKQMLPSFSTNQERVEAEASFLEEMKTLAAMSHPNIPTISDFFTQNTYAFIVQEFISGEDLQKKLDAAGGKGLPEKQVLGWVSQVLSVLVYLEGLDPQLIHRDIKPANIIVDTGGRVHLVDFGVASHKFRVGAPAAGVNKTSTAMGTPGYAPREQFLAQETTRSDLYALGATMHQLLTGRNPQGVEPLFSYPPIKQLNPQVSDATIRIVEKALQNDLARRYQSAAKMKADVDLLLAPRGLLSSARSKIAALVVVMLALVAVGGGAALYEQRQATLPPTGAVSMGKVAFDVDVTGRVPTAANNNIGSAADAPAWAKAKKDASVQWKDGNISRAQALYQQASTNDQTDAESLIYSENASIFLSNQPYYVIAVGSSFSGPKISTGRFALQGAYTAQHEINLNGGIGGRKLVLELANDASGASGAVEAAKAAASDSRVLAFLGYSSSSRTKAAIPYLAEAGIPMLTPTSSNPSLNGSSFFFRLCPSDTVQGQDLANYAKTLLALYAHPRIVVFRDPNDAYSNGLATIFTTDMAGSATLVQENYTAQSAAAAGTSPQAYQTMLQQLSSTPGLIVFTGYASDGLRLGQALDALGDQFTPVLSDDAFYDPAEFIAYGSVYKGCYHFTGYFYPDQGSLLPRTSIGAQTIATMESEYATNFRGPGKPNGYGYARVPSEAALFYDAVKVTAQALEKLGPDVTRTRLSDAIAGAQYQGVAGQIHFNETPPSPADPNALGIGDPIDKALLVMHMDDLGHTHPDKLLGRFE